ncbi:MAG: hypothetical protein WCQ32_02075 [bacterium]
MEFPYFKKVIVEKVKEERSDEEKVFLQNLAENTMKDVTEKMNSKDPYESYHATQTPDDIALNLDAQRILEERDFEGINSGEAEVLLNRLINKRSALNQKIHYITDFLSPDIEQINKLNAQLQEIRLQETELEAAILAYKGYYGARAEEHPETQRALAEYDLYIKKLRDIEKKIEDLSNAAPATSEEEDLWEKRKQELLKEEREIQKLFENAYDKIPGNNDFTIYNN